jgi:hypothetical protein
MNVSGAHVSKTSGSATYLAILDQKGDLFTTIADMGVTEELSVEFIARHQAVLRSASIVLMDGNLPESTITAAAKVCAQRRVPGMCFE